VTSVSKHRLFRLHFFLFILSPVIGGGAVCLEAHSAAVVKSDIYFLQMATKDGRSIYGGPLYLNYCSKLETKLVQ
jgi:hypothetical protein